MRCTSLRCILLHTPRGVAFCVVLPSETQQLPQRLAASAWRLARNASGCHVAGCSGTNDNHLLLPLHVPATGRHQQPHAAGVAVLYDQMRQPCTAGASLTRQYGTREVEGSGSNDEKRCCVAMQLRGRTSILASRF